MAAQPASPAGAPLAQSTVVRREDYRAPDWQVDSVVLHFCLDADNTVVTAACQYRRARRPRPTPHCGWMARRWRPWRWR